MEVELEIPDIAPARRSKLMPQPRRRVDALDEFSLTRSPHSSLTYLVAVASVFSGTS
jgi:hypothetical protein